MSTNPSEFEAADPTDAPTQSAAPTCCGSERQSTCCDESEKSSCCAPAITAEGGCGCQ